MNKTPNQKNQKKNKNNNNAQRIQQTIARNKKANFNYDILDTIEAGIELKGGEVKNIRKFGINIDESYVKFFNQESYLVNSNVKINNNPGFDPYSPKRDRRLLLHKKQIINLTDKTKLQSHTIIPLSVYFIKNGLIKVLLGVGVGKKLYDKRRSLKEKEWERDKNRLLKQFK